MMRKQVVITVIYVFRKRYFNDKDSFCKISRPVGGDMGKKVLGVKIAIFAEPFVNDPLQKFIA